MKTILKVFFSLFLVVTFTALLCTLFALPLVPVLIGALIVSGFTPMPKGVALGVVLEQWATYIMERFWKDNGFLRNAYDDSRYVQGGRIVHIPQPGSKPGVVKNRSTFPGTAVRRTDTDVLYALDEYSTNPTHIPHIDAIHLSYDMQDSVLGDHLAELDEVVAEDMLIKWGTNGSFFATTGGPTAGTQGPVTGQTGNRLGFHHKDSSKLMAKFNTDGLPKNDRYLLIDDNMFEFYYDSLSDNQQKDFSRYIDAENGVVGKLHGFNIMTRASVLASTNVDAIKALGAALAATDNLCSLAWHKNSVAFAIGDKKLFQDKDSAIYYGDVHSALVMAGGRVRRADGKGIYVIKQGTPA